LVVNVVDLAIVCSKAKEGNFSPSASPKVYVIGFVIAVAVVVGLCNNSILAAASKPLSKGGVKVLEFLAVL